MEEELRKYRESKDSIRDKQQERKIDNTLKGLIDQGSASIVQAVKQGTKHVKNKRVGSKREMKSRTEEYLTINECVYGNYDY